MKAAELKRKLNEVVSRISYKDWSFILAEKHNVPFLQVSFRALDATTGLSSIQYGRRWMLSSEMSASEIVQTALMAVLAAEEHEAREEFIYRGARVFQPHIDVDAIAILSSAILSSAKTVHEQLNAIESLDPFHDLT